MVTNQINSVARASHLADLRIGISVSGIIGHTCLSSKNLLKHAFYNDDRHLSQTQKRPSRRDEERRTDVIFGRWNRDPKRDSDTDGMTRCRNSLSRSRVTVDRLSISSSAGQIRVYQRLTNPPMLNPFPNWRKQ